MNEGDNALVILIILILVFLPFGWLILAFSAEPYHVVTGEPLREAAQNAGINVVSSTNVTWPFPGATGGKNYVLEDTQGNTLNIQTQTFDSAASRDAAIQTYAAQSVGKGKPVGALVVIGQLVIYIPPDQRGIMTKVIPELRKNMNSEKG
jgi:hypothetical protein